MRERTQQRRRKVVVEHMNCYGSVYAELSVADRMVLDTIRDARGFFRQRMTAHDISLRLGGVMSERAITKSALRLQAIGAIKAVDGGWRR